MVYSTFSLAYFICHNEFVAYVCCCMQQYFILFFVAYVYRCMQHYFILFYLAHGLYYSSILKYFALSFWVCWLYVDLKVEARPMDA